MKPHADNRVLLLLWTSSLLLLWGFVPVQSETPKITILSWQLNHTLMRVKPECDAGTAKEGECEHQATFSIDLIRMTRLFNPSSQTRFMLLVDAAPYVEYAHYRREVERAQIEVRLRDQFRPPGSRALKYEEVHAKFGLRHLANMMSRFCEWADLAKAENLTRVLTLDSDVALFDNVDEVFGPFTEDVVVPCTLCSQNVLWSVKALDKFCDGLIEFWLRPPEEVFRDSVNYRVIHQTTDAWNDMVFLDIWLRNNWGGHNLTWISLTAERNPTPRIPHPGVWQGGITVQTANPTMMDHTVSHPRGWYNLDCAKFWELFDFKPTATSNIPLPTHIPSGITFPLLHFHQKCKTTVVDPVYKKFYKPFYDAMYK